MSANEEAGIFPAEFKKLIKDEGYHPKQVSSCDEIGFFWKKMSNRMYIHKSVKQAQVF